ncbi:hypothetical protein [Streptomyces sp. NWU339]|uniref:hypothetical protein n=1 Tax=Streptomyces sp. NWU339 TaxID=2185284 RepID=UPI0015E81E8C|nr:hypothetical protein [Streptomyces sp. NWU339]
MAAVGRREPVQAHALLAPAGHQPVGGALEGLRQWPHGVVTATGQLLNALADVENTARLEAALETFGQAVNAATAPRLSWWARRRAVPAG